MPAPDRQNASVAAASLQSSNRLPVLLLPASYCSNMYTVSLPKPLVLTFVALSSSLWFTSTLLFAAMAYGEVGEGKISVFDFVSGLTEIK